MNASHDRRPPARSLLSPLVLVLAVLLVPGCRGTKAPQDREAPSGVEQALSEAVRALDDGDADAALNRLDPYYARVDGLPRGLAAELCFVFGRANLTLAKELMRAKNRSSSIVTGCLTDAARALDRAARLWPEDPRPRRLLGETRLLQGAFEDAAAAYAAARALLESGARASHAEAHALRVAEGEALLRQLVARRRAEGSTVSRASEDLCDRLLEVLDPALGDRATQARAYRIAVQALQWIDNAGEAYRLVADAVERDPGDLELEALAAEAARRAGGLPDLARRLKRVAETEPDDDARAVAWFYLGHSRTLLADSARGLGRGQRAAALYEQAAEAFRQAAARPDFRRNAKLRAALCEVSRAWLALEAGDLERAESALTRAYAETPAIAETTPEGWDRWFDGFRKSYRSGIYALGARLTQAGLEEALRFWRTVTKRHPDWAQAWNNLGLAARDLGVRRARAGRPEEARSLYEESYAAYRKAVAGLPDDPRIVNDCALMLVYYLEREPQRARSMLERAIRLGRQALAALPPKSSGEDPATAGRRRFLEEAVGDAWQNLGVLDEKLGHPEAARRAFAEAVKYYPYARREAARRLRRLEAAASRPASRRGGCLVPPGPAAPALVLPPEDPIAEGRKDLAAGRAEDLLARIEPLLAEHEKDPEYWYLAGRGSLLFARQALAGGTSGDAAANLVDAAERFARAERLAARAAAPHYGRDLAALALAFRIESLLLRDRGEDALKATGAAAAVLAAEPGPSPAAAAWLEVQAARAAARAAIARLKQKKKAAQLLASARREGARARRALAALGSGRALERRLRTLLEETPDLAGFFRLGRDLALWARDHDAALRILTEGALLLGAGAAKALLADAAALAARGGAAKTLTALAPLFARLHSDPTARWYEAYFTVLAGHEARLEGANDRALARYAKARELFAQVVEREPKFAANSRYWQAMARAAEAWIQHGEGKTTEAERAWLEAISIDRRAATAPDAVTGKSAKQGLLALGGRHFAKRDFAAGVALFERARKVLPADPDILNNLALFLRELGLRTQGAKAKEAFRRSWTIYHEALDADPGNVRLINDTALIDVYYLHEHDREAEQLLREAVRRGKARLGARRAVKDPAARRDLEEAVGDALMNLGVLLRRLGRRREARAAFEESLDYYPGRRRASVRFLAEMQREDARAAGKEAPASRASGSGGRKQP